MNQKTRMILSILLIAACLGYTVINYIQGKTEPGILILACAVLGFPLINITRALIDELRG